MPVAEEDIAKVLELLEEYTEEIMEFLGGARQGISEGNIFLKDLEFSEVNSEELDQEFQDHRDRLLEIVERTPDMLNEVEDFVRDQMSPEDLGTDVDTDVPDLSEDLHDTLRSMYTAPSMHGTINGYRVSVWLFGDREVCDLLYIQNLTTREDSAVFISIV